MTTNASLPKSRQDWLSSLFPRDVPTLWCPPLTHYTKDGAIDRARMAAHLRFLSPWVKGLLVPGTTGDAWELTLEETSELTDIVLKEIPFLGLSVLLGTLHPDMTQTRTRIEDGLAKLKQKAGTPDLAESLKKNRVCGFAVCPPRGAEMTQDVMQNALCSVLELGVPLALYQLPQVTQNEMSPKLVADLALRFSTFILFKDTSGTDRVALSALDFRGVFLARGMEGDFGRWLKAAGGPYDGFLLSSANSFGPQLHEIREMLISDRSEEAHGLSYRLTNLISQLFGLVDSIPDGNPFANANKAADHYFAHGPKAADAPPPRLHSGAHLPVEVIRATGDALTSHGLMPTRGYLE